MERWEYQVIHLNVEAPTPPVQPSAPPPAAPPAVEPPAGASPIRVEAVFSKEYLEKEFPGFYGPPAEGAPAREHPANQLRGFLNLQGREGWELLGFYPVGQLQMMIFRRPLVVSEPSAAPLATASSPPPADSSTPEAASSRREAQAVAPSSEQPQAQAAALERILARLEALERRLEPPGVAESGVEVGPSLMSGLQDGAILPPQRMGELDGLPRLSTPQAARALGFRSSASLLNLAARSGYRPGLVKRGANDALAVYAGSEKSGQGGRDRRLWVVLQVSAG